jgi:hypothetical protein
VSVVLCIKIIIAYLPRDRFADGNNGGREATKHAVFSVNKSQHKKASVKLKINIFFWTPCKPTCWNSWNNFGLAAWRECLTSGFIFEQSIIVSLFFVLVLCTQVNMVFVMLHWVCIHTENAWKICLPTVARHIFQACMVWIHTQSNITNIIIVSLLTGFFTKAYSEHDVLWTGTWYGFVQSANKKIEFWSDTCYIIK